MRQWEKLSTESGLRIFRPPTFKAGQLDIEAARKALSEVGIVVVTSVLSAEGVDQMVKSILEDFHRATTRYRMNELLARVPGRQISAFEVHRSLGALQRPLLPPRERVAIDGVLNGHRMPLTSCAQLRRVHPAARHVFSQLYGVEADDLCQQPDAARVIFEQHLANESLEKPHGMSPEEIMFRRLNGTWQPPHRFTGYQAYQSELERRLGDKCHCKFGIVGLLSLTDFRGGPTQADGSVQVGPCLTAVPAYKQSAMRRVHTLGHMAGPVAARRAALRRYQVLNDDELEDCMDDFSCIVAPAGSLVLWRRDLPVAFNSGNSSMAEPDVTNPYKVAYAAQQITWLPRYAQLESERDKSLHFMRHKPTSTTLYEMRSLTRPQVKNKRRGWRKKRKLDERDESDALNDIPIDFCQTLKIQLSAL